MGSKLNLTEYTVKPEKTGILGFVPEFICISVY